MSKLESTVQSRLFEVDKRCSIEGCQRRHKAHGWCDKHYWGWYAYGDPLCQPLTRDPVCAVENCERPRKTREWCGAHWRRWRKYGDPLGQAPDKPKLCAIEGCEKPRRTRGWCTAHYQQWHRTGDPLYKPPRKTALCTVDGCEKPSRARGWCTKHYGRWKQHGDPLYLHPTARPFDPNTTEKLCTSCGAVKLLEEFYRKSAKRDGRDSQCKDCVKPALAEYGRKNRDKTRLYNRKYRERNPNRDREYYQRRMAENPDELRRKYRQYEATHRAAINARSRRYRKENPESYRISVRRRRARKRKVGGSISKAEWQAKLEVYSGYCHWCVKKIVGSVQMDHVMPMCLGGRHVIFNVVPSCGPCNRKKGAKHPDVWREQLRREKGGESF